MIIRNDDVAFDTDLDELKWFCDLCDEYGHKIIQCITPLGICIPIHVNMTNDQIVALGGHNTILHNEPLHEYLIERANRDYFAVHGLWHTHAPSHTDVWTCKALLSEAGLPVTYFVPPFNQGEYDEHVCGLKLCQYVDSIENSINQKCKLTTNPAYLHSWRFSSRQFSHAHLENFFKDLA